MNRPEPASLAHSMSTKTRGWLFHTYKLEDGKHPRVPWKEYNASCLLSKKNFKAIKRNHNMVAETSVTELFVVLFCCFKVSSLSPYISDATLSVWETLSHLILIMTLRGTVLPTPIYREGNQARKETLARSTAGRKQGWDWNPSSPGSKACFWPWHAIPPASHAHHLPQHLPNKGLQNQRVCESVDKGSPSLPLFNFKNINWWFLGFSVITIIKSKELNFWKQIWPIWTAGLKTQCIIYS